MHTPGPLIVEPSLTDADNFDILKDRYIGNDRDPILIATVYGDDDRDQAFSDAIVFAHAPAMRETLEELVKCFEPGLTTPEQRLHEVTTKARALLRALDTP